ncbi:MAG: hypothetical protein ACE5J5_07310 [Candidatus Hydrothermarchaeales archaeon]
MSLRKTIVGNLLFSVTKAVDKKVDLKQAAIELDTKTDEKIGEKASEKIQRDPVTNSLLEFIEGLWNEDPKSLAERLRAKAQDIEDQLQEEG